MNWCLIWDNLYYPTTKHLVSVWDGSNEGSLHRLYIPGIVLMRGHKICFDELTKEGSQHMF